jgi:hypothetical protein
MPKRHPGDVIQLSLPNGRYAYARRYLDASMAVYQTTTDIPGQPPIGERDFRVIVGVDDAVVNSAPLVGRDPFDEPDDAWPPPYFIRDPINGDYSTYHRGVIKPATVAECAGLEQAAALGAHAHP